MASTTKGAIARLMQEYKDLEKEPWANITVNMSPHKRCIHANAPQIKEDEMFKWGVALLPLNEDSYYYCSYLKVS